MTLRLGRLPNDPTRPRLRLTAALNYAPTPPPAADWLSKVPAWPMYLNDRLGDCTCAGAAHMLQAWTAYGRGHEVDVNNATVLRAYEAVSGYDPGTGANDHGAVMQDVLDYWRKTGLRRHRIAAFAQIDPSRIALAEAALSALGGLYVGINLPDSAHTQFRDGRSWDVVTGAQVVGGHAIHVGGYNHAAGMWQVVTWGKVQPMTQAFWDEYVEECWVALTVDWLSMAGRNPLGLDRSALAVQYKTLTGENAPWR